MTTFVFESASPPTWGAFLIPVPLVSWFNDSVLQALSEMTIRENWRGDDTDQLKIALGYASEMLARYQLLNFNPFPVGMIVPFGGAIAPAGYLLCDGASYTVEDYPELFAQIGYYWGGSDDDFNVPNLINRNVVGAGGDFDFGTTGGEQSVTLEVGQIPAHSHSDNGHSHSIPLITSVPTQEGVGISRNITVPILTDSTGIGYADISETGGDGEHNNMPPYLATIYIIYAGRDNA